MYTMNVPDAVAKALEHIREQFHTVKTVDFYDDGSWWYHDGNGSGPAFQESHNISVDILQKAADSTPAPRTYRWVDVLRQRRKKRLTALAKVV